MGEKRIDVAALGELLIDFTDFGRSPRENRLFEMNPGGAPCNALAMLAKLGHSCAFLGKVGDDLFGTFLRDTLAEVGIQTPGLILDPSTRTTLAFVANQPNGERSFSFYRAPGADMMLTCGEVSRETIADAKIFHFGSLSLTDEPVRSATVQALAWAKEAHALISFDPNLRPPLWRDLELAREQIAFGLAQCDILKISDDELRFMTGLSDLAEGAAALRARYPQIRLLNVTAGSEGSYCYYQDTVSFQPAFLLGGTVDTTGAGDTFCGCVLHFVLEHGLDALSRDDIAAMLRFASAAAYLVTTKPGALHSMPEPEQIRAVLAAGEAT